MVLNAVAPVENASHGAAKTEKAADTLAVKNLKDFSGDENVASKEKDTEGGSRRVFNGVLGHEGIKK